MAYANNAYQRRSAQSLPPRDIEAAAFEFVNRSLRSTGTDKDRVTALSRNRKLWSLLLTDLGMTNNTLPPVLKQDLVSVGSWSIDYSIRAMLQGLDLQPLIAINQDMIDALRANAMPEPQIAAREAAVVAADRGVQRRPVHA